MNLVKAITTVAILGALGSCSSIDKSINETEQHHFTLSIAHVNDTHSSFDPSHLDFTAQIESKDFAVRSSVGGYPRITTALKAARIKAKNMGRPFLALHGGDAFQGSLYFNVLKGKGNAILLSEMGLDAMAIGNHEFDLGNNAFIEFAESVNFPILAANLDSSADAKMRDISNIKPYVLKQLNGEKVGVFGLVLEDMRSISSPGEHLVFKEEIETAQATVDVLHKLGVDKVIMVSHIGLSRDISIAKNVNGVDVIVGGHSHTLLGDFTNIGNGNGSAIAGYAEMFTNPNGVTQTCIVQAGAYAQAIGQVDIKFVNGEVSACDGNNTLLIDKDFVHKYDGENRETLTKEDQFATETFVSKQKNIAITEEDKRLREIINGNYKPLIKEYEGKIIGQVFDANDPTDKGTLDNVRIPGISRNGGASLPITGSEAGAQVAASMVWKLNKAGYNVDVAITNLGGVRNHIVSGPNGLSAGYIVGKLLNFSNELAVVELKGSDIKDLLEKSINYAMTTSSGSFPTFANLEVTFNGLANPGEQIEILNICSEGVASGNCVPMQNDIVYKIATNAYIASGKDGYDIFNTKKQSELILSGFIDNESMIEYVQDLTAQGRSLTEIPSGLTFIAPRNLKIDDPIIKAEDN